MKSLRDWSTTSATCRIDVPASRWQAASFVLLGVLAAFGVLNCEMPVWASAPLSIALFARGVVLARRELSRPTRCLLISTPAGLTVDSEPVDTFSVVWRGPVAFIRWCTPDGMRGCCVLTPDIFDARGRRALRIAAPAERGSTQRPATVAP